MNDQQDQTEFYLIAGCGYLGHRVATSWCNNAGHVSAITRSTSRAETLQAQGITPVVLDLAEPQANSLPTADVVLWAVGFDRSAGIPREKVWIDGLQWLVNNLKSAPRRFIYVSSTSVYGQSGGEAVDEETPVSPTTEGGKCCVEAERMLRDECGRRLPDSQVVALRMAGIYGPNRLLRRVADLQSQTPLPGEPDHWLNLIHVDDAVRMVCYAASSDQVPDIINVVNTETASRAEYYKKLADLASAPQPVFGVRKPTGRLRSGNKRVTSKYDLSSVAYEFNDILVGLANAFERTKLAD